MLIVQTLSPINKFLNSYLKRNPNASLSTLFKHIRGLKTVSFLGDWLLIAELVTRLNLRGVRVSKKAVLSTFKLSTDPILKRQRSDSELVAILIKEDNLRAKKTARK